MQETPGPGVRGGAQSPHGGGPHLLHRIVFRFICQKPHHGIRIVSGEFFGGGNPYAPEGITLEGLNQGIGCISPGEFGQSGQGVGAQGRILGFEEDALDNRIIFVPADAAHRYAGEAAMAQRPHGILRRRHQIIGGRRIGQLSQGYDERGYQILFGDRIGFPEAL